MIIKNAWEFDGYWKDVGTVDSLWEANMDLLKDKDLDLYKSKKIGKSILKTL